MQTVTQVKKVIEDYAVGYAKDIKSLQATYEKLATVNHRMPTV